MGRIKKYLCVLLCLTMVMLTACSNADTRKSDAAKTGQTQTSREETKDQKGRKNQKDQKGQTAGQGKKGQATGEGKIPEELLPSKKDGEAENKDGGMEIVREDGTSYVAKDEKQDQSGGAGSSGNSANTSNGTSAGNAGPAEKNPGVINIGFTVESSSADGSVSYQAAMTLDEGATVYDALSATGMSISGKSYISAIGGLSEGLFGSKSGWKYYVNGTAPNKSCTNYVLKDGDNVQWSYVLNP